MAKHDAAWYRARAIERREEVKTIHRAERDRYNRDLDELAALLDKIKREA